MTTMATTTMAATSTAAAVSSVDDEDDDEDDDPPKLSAGTLYGQAFENWCGTGAPGHAGVLFNAGPLCLHGLVGMASLSSSSSSS